MDSRVARVGGLVLLAWACQPGGEGGDSAEQGAERGSCYPNDTCNEGLRCLSNLCVREDGPSTAGCEAGVVDGAGRCGVGTGDDRFPPSGPAACEAGVVNDAGECLAWGDDGWGGSYEWDAAWTEPDAAAWDPPRGDYCIDGCFNQTCPGTYEMCTVDAGECVPVDCADDWDCLNLSECDDPDRGSSPDFICDDNGQCKRG